LITLGCDLVSGSLVSLVTTPEFREHPKVADAASELLVSVFGADKTSTRLVFGMASLSDLRKRGKKDGGATSSGDDEPPA
jgi:hypothetical protein